MRRRTSLPSRCTCRHRRAKPCGYPFSSLLKLFRRPSGACYFAPNICFRCPRICGSSQDVLRGRWIAGALQPRLAVVPAPACAVPATRASRGAPRGGELQREPITTGLWNMGPRNGVPATAKARLRASVTRYASRGAPRGDDRVRVCNPITPRVAPPRLPAKIACAARQARGRECARSSADRRRRCRSPAPRGRAL